MNILRFFKRLINDAIDMDGNAILIIALIILLIISYFRRKSTQWDNEDLNKDILDSKQAIKNTELAKGKLEIDLNQIKKEAENEREKFKIDLNKNRKQIESYQKNETQFRDQISELKIEFNKIREKYSSSYEQLLHSRENNKATANQLQTYRLSPHFLKNLINKTFIESKLSFDDDDLKTSFSILGKKYSTKENLIDQLKIYNEKLDKSLLLLIDTLNYLLYSSGVTKVHLETETSQLQKFCQLIEINKDIKVEMVSELDNSNFYIPPTILFNYLDNAIKHGYFKNKPLRIELSCKKNILHYAIETPLHPKMDPEKILGGIGNTDFENSINRNSNTYEISNEIVNNTYIANLKIAL
ncbi:hypothetical protein [Labilibaculum manganireducens]|uniref:hypothetical protein n=1 Tax=Labilibaculum manganireducens TaxID=1940525 RepID=UPI0029F56BD5|nr:hypothetical protein [Labilibaculum manganireducens]